MDSDNKYKSLFLPACVTFEIFSFFEPEQLILCRTISKKFLSVASNAAIMQSPYLEAYFIKNQKVLMQQIAAEEEKYEKSQYAGDELFHLSSSAYDTAKGVTTVHLEFLKAITKPDPLVLTALGIVSLLLKVKGSAIREDGTANFKWATCLSMACSSKSLLQMKNYEPGSTNPKLRKSIEKLIEERGVTEKKLIQLNRGAAHFFYWAKHIIEFEALHESLEHGDKIEERLELLRLKLVSLKKRQNKIKEMYQKHIIKLDK